MRHNSTKIVKGSYAGIPFNHPTKIKYSTSTVVTLKVHAIERLQKSRPRSHIQQRSCRWRLRAGMFVQCIPMKVFTYTAVHCYQLLSYECIGWVWFSAAAANGGIAAVYVNVALRMPFCYSYNNKQINEAVVHPTTSHSTLNMLMHVRFIPFFPLNKCKIFYFIFNVNKISVHAYLNNNLSKTPTTSYLVVRTHYITYCIFNIVRSFRHYKHGISWLLLE